METYKNTIGDFNLVMITNLDPHHKTPTSNSLDSLRILAIV